jgi:hypothetical protein
MSSSLPPENPYGLERPPFPPSAPARDAIPVAIPPVIHTPAPHARPDVTTWLLAGGVVLSATAIVVGIASASWFSARGASVGLLGVQACHGGDCVTRSWSDIHAASDVVLFSAIGLVGALASIVMAGIVTVLVVIGKEAKIPYGSSPAPSAAPRSAAWRSWAGSPASDEGGCRSATPAS